MWHQRVTKSNAGTESLSWARGGPGAEAEGSQVGGTKQSQRIRCDTPCAELPNSGHLACGHAHVAASSQTGPEMNSTLTSALAEGQGNRKRVLARCRGFQLDQECLISLSSLLVKGSEENTLQFSHWPFVSSARQSLLGTAPSFVSTGSHDGLSPPQNRKMLPATRVGIGCLSQVPFQVFPPN